MLLLVIFINTSINSNRTIIMISLKSCIMTHRRWSYFFTLIWQVRWLFILNLILLINVIELIPISSHLIRLDLKIIRFPCCHSSLFFINRVKLLWSWALNICYIICQSFSLRRYCNLWGAFLNLADSHYSTRLSGNIILWF